MVYIHSILCACYIPFGTVGVERYLAHAVKALKAVICSATVWFSGSGASSRRHTTEDELEKKVADGEVSVNCEDLFS